MVIGIGMVALPTGIPASAFFSGQLRKRRAQYEELVDIAFEDSILTAEEEPLEYMRLKLGINLKGARKTYRKINKTESANIVICPHCNNPLASNNDQP